MWFNIQTTKPFVPDEPSRIIFGCGLCQLLFIDEIKICTFNDYWQQLFYTMVVIFPFNKDLTSYINFFAMQSIRKSECPQELAPADRRTVVHVNLVKKEQECPVRYLHLFDFFLHIQIFLRSLVILITAIFSVEYRYRRSDPIHFRAREELQVATMMQYQQRQLLQAICRVPHHHQWAQLWIRHYLLPQFSSGWQMVHAWFRALIFIIQLEISVALLMHPDLLRQEAIICRLWGSLRNNSPIWSRPLKRLVQPILLSSRSSRKLGLFFWQLKLIYYFCIFYTKF